MRVERKIRSFKSLRMVSLGEFIWCFLSFFRLTGLLLGGKLCVYNLHFGRISLQCFRREKSSFKFGKLPCYWDIMGIDEHLTQCFFFFWGLGFKNTGVGFFMNMEDMGYGTWALGFGILCICNSS